MKTKTEHEPSLHDQELRALYLAYYSTTDSQISFDNYMYKCISKAL